MRFAKGVGSPPHRDPNISPILREKCGDRRLRCGERVQPIAIGLQALK